MPTYCRLLKSSQPTQSQLMTFLKIAQALLPLLSAFSYFPLTLRCYSLLNISLGLSSVTLRTSLEDDVCRVIS